jgi:putative methionine-R-sulfoxide reductase with GAF domain
METFIVGQLNFAGLPVVSKDNLVEAVRAESRREAPVEDRARRIADLVRTKTGRRWVGIYRVTSNDVVNLAWSGPAPPAYPRFPATRGLTGAAIASRSSVVSNDVARDPRYLTALQSTGSELILPVLVEGRVVGTLDVEDERIGAFDDDDQALFEQLAQALTGLYT